MNKSHARPAGKRGGEKKGAEAAPSGGTSRLLRFGWGFLAAALVLALIVGLRLASERPEEETPTPSPDPGPAGSAFSGQGVQSLTTGQGDGGRAVKIAGVDCDYTPPGEITFGLLENVELSDLGDRAAENAEAAGWGTIVWSVTENGSLLLRAQDPPVLGGDDFEKQKEFLASEKPEGYARTFLENSGLVSLLRDYGLSLDTTRVENDQGEIVFSGASAQPGGECEIRLTFHFSGAFNQATVRATYLAGAVTTDRVVPLKRAVENAVTWTAGEGETRVTAVELRLIRGLPFYALTCADGSVAYALAVETDALADVPGAEEVYRELLSTGIQDNVTASGLE